MRRQLTFVGFLVAIAFPALSQKSVPASNLEWVDPVIGNVGQLLEPTLPVVHLPNQMIRVSPQRKDYLDQYISSFPLNIVSHRLGQVFSLKPAVGDITAASWDNRMRFDHDLEERHPWWYSTWLLDDEVGVEFAPGEKTGVYRFSFPEGASKSLLFSTYNDGPASFQFTEGRVFRGMETYHGDIAVYTYGEFSVAGKPGVLKGGQVSESDAITGQSPRALIRFEPAIKKVEFRYAISYISAEQAKRNFDKGVRAKSFTDVQAHAKREWATRLDQIQVEGGTPAQKRAFFTALYRTMERMVNITEDGQYYSGFDKKIHQDNRPFYVDDWTWDTYLAHHPLRMILDPAQESDMLQSFVRMYEQGGWMPTFPVLFGDHACMNGFHSSIVFLDAYRKGLKEVDFAKAYEGMRKNATDATMIPWVNGPKTSLDDYYQTNGYFPALAPGEKETVPAVHHFERRQAVAVTLGHSYDDWAVAEMARELSKADDWKKFEPRSRNYKNLWQEKNQFFMPRNDKGEWIGIDPLFDGGKGGRDYYDENNGYTYLWQVQQDIPGLINLMGGRKAFEKRLDQLFSTGLGRSKYEFWNEFPDATGLVGQYSMGNEPSFHIPYLYNFTEAPWKTQQKVRFLLDVWFKDNIFGIPGDEDGGGMTAFVVFSSMGFYPITPGLPLYTIGSPLFSKVSIRLPNGKSFILNAKNCSVKNKYIQSATINGKPLDGPWFTHEQLMQGGRVDLQMGPYPNKKWGTAGRAGF
ncbi:GH92 family glycosyl hydrolase [Flavihumibacter petaseus]|uniref:Putative glycosidase n=1 Tax=Flavihumibacter petaseus NBRC 106054 TaxID=1220578 RepID=A0A0E9MYI0_9BACT|nr:GH92 family glycosyl hydrolase [Flavihumibacter petaseus]GAO42563.1 putative glycosidase [Flavihumibacter petaseus NBRC 106054]